MRFRRRGIEKGLVGGVVALLVIVVGVGYYLSTSVLGSSSTTQSSSGGAVSSSSTGSASSTSPSSSAVQTITVTSGNVTTTTTTSYGLDITNMYADMIGAGLQAPYQNSSSVGDNSVYHGTPGQQIQVEFDVVYQLCANGSCPSQVSAVVIANQGFSIIPPTVPPMPVACVATTGVNIECEFLVTVQTPSTPYTGTLTLVAQG